MPVYEFTCLDCKYQFEELCAMGCKSIPCPNCTSGNTERRISIFAAQSSGSEGTKSIGGSHSCGSCHSHNCSTCH